jgi:hypothetical protein
MAAAASLERLDCNQITASEVLDSRAAGHHFSAQLMAEYDRVLDAGERVR